MPEIYHNLSEHLPFIMSWLPSIYLYVECYYTTPPCQIPNMQNPTDTLYTPIYSEKKSYSLPQREYGFFSLCGSVYGLYSLSHSEYRFLTVVYEIYPLPYTTATQWGKPIYTVGQWYMKITLFHIPLCGCWHDVVVQINNPTAHLWYLSSKSHIHSD